MHIAIGYNWYPAALGFHLERAFLELGHHVTYVGLPTAQRGGFDSRVPLPDVLAQLPKLPDVFLWIDPAAPYFPLGIEDAPIPTICYLVDVHLGHWRSTLAKFFDGVLIAQADALTQFRTEVGHDRVFWLPLAAAGDMHHDWGLERIYEVGFVGNLDRAHQRTARAQYLACLQQHFKTNDFYAAYTPAETGRVYSQTKIVPNINIAGDVTMRLFEGAACGALVLTNTTHNQIEALFALGNELVMFADETDLLEKVRYYLSHETERAVIAQAAQQRVRREHLYTHRAQAILQYTFTQNAPMRTASPIQRYQARRKVYTHLHMVDAMLDLSRSQNRPRWQRIWHSLPILFRRWLI